MLLLSNFGVGLFCYLKALLANLLGKERGPPNEKARKLLYFASLGILAEFSTYQFIFIFFLDYKLILQYYFYIKRYKNKTKVYFCQNLGCEL